MVMLAAVTKVPIIMAATNQLGKAPTARALYNVVAELISLPLGGCMKILVIQAERMMVAMKA